ncbi:helix-turn-helix domain-containing protein [Aquamicrobium zhengzhouense]|uniref:Helix-turn-helix domain-containing protein n=1 Tax=Aquamicrobium zhengzhouense TaxID=2781738 RepID=A0ABS0S8F7_9HYPH|nr:helix-turn-helix domain-containing protein [Aquamicrobium zhengzhouense]MBI1619074.1 helix-turn-helix domain-containing protein [Aquamicrobium zhengzhouense]
MSNSIPSYRLYREQYGESGDFWIHCETIPERTHLHNWEISPHRHESLFQIFFMSEGAGEIAGQHGSSRFKAPCAIFIPPREVHGFSYSRDVDGLVLTVVSDRLTTLAAADRQVALFASKIRIVPTAPEDADAMFAIECVRKLFDELTGRAHCRLLLLEPLMTGAIVGLVRSVSAAGAADDGLDDRDRHRIETLATLIAANFREHKPVSFYSETLGVSAAHLNRIARRATGYSVLGLITMQLLEAARRDLVFTPTSVQGIAYGLGFSDPAYFNRFFRRQTGMTPGAFREAERRKQAL